MSAPKGLYFAGDVGAVEAYRQLMADQTTLLVDVRTRAELQFVGVADLSEAGKNVLALEWTSFPEGAKNPNFEAALSEAVGASGATAVYLMCRSGARSRAAALAAEGMEAERTVALWNVSDGFEGPLNPDGKRGMLTGWKAGGLPWRQS